MRRKPFGASARRAGLHVDHVAGVERVRVKRIVHRFRYLEIRTALVSCRECGSAWRVEIDPQTERPRKGWRKCPRGCNAGALAQG